MTQFKVGDIVKPDAAAIVKDSEACGYPCDFDSLDQSIGTIVAIESDRCASVRWEDGMTNKQELAYLIKLN